MKTILSSTILLLALTGVAHADTLVVDKVAADTQVADARPNRGMTMETVNAQFGEPKEKLPSVGEPPITRWIYDGYIVYFEKDRVLHAVVRR